jgi:hypothetical protein
LERHPKATVDGGFSIRFSLATQEAIDGFVHVIDFSVISYISSSPSPLLEVAGTIAIVDNRAANRRR